MKILGVARSVVATVLLACTPNSEPVGGTGGTPGDVTSTGPGEKGPTTGGAVSGTTGLTVTGDGESGATPGGLDLGGGADDSTGSSGGESDEGSGSAGQNCGDGEIDPGTLELCDHDLDELSSEEMPKWVECRDCVPAGDILFVLAQPVVFSAAGLAGADEQCRAEASAFSLTRADDCVALLLDESADPEARFEHFLMSDDPLVRPNGEIIASSLSALAEMVPAGKDLRGLKEPLDDTDPRVWTGFSPRRRGISGRSELRGVVVDRRVGQGSLRTIPPRREGLRVDRRQDVRWWSHDYVLLRQEGEALLFMSESDGGGAVTAVTRPLAGAARFVPVPVAEPWIEPPEEITWTGRTVGGRYAVCERIGGGGMADVYRARDERLQQDVALKVLRSSLASRELRARMLQEARAAAAIEHPHMLRVLDVGEELGTTYIAMELLRGAPLSRLLHEAGGRLPWRQVVPLLLPAAAALQHAHACGFVHRDIKPDNLWVAERGGAPWIVVLDLGIAKAERARRGADSPPTTEMGRALGTPRYMSPEQAAGQAVDARSDVFSFAVTLFRALTGGFPWTARSDGASVEPRAALQAPELDVPAALCDAIVRALARRPEERLPSMRALATLLHEAVALPVRRRGTTVSWALTGALGGALAMAGTRALGRGEPSPANVPRCPDCVQRDNVQMALGFERAPDVQTALAGGRTEESGPVCEEEERVVSVVSESEVTPPARVGKATSGRVRARAPDLLELTGPELRRCYEEFGGAEPVEFRVRMAAGGERGVELTLTPDRSPLGRCVRAGFAALMLPPRAGRWTYQREFRLGPGGVR